MSREIILPRNNCQAFRASWEKIFDVNLGPIRVQYEVLRGPYNAKAGCQCRSMSVSFS
jgi:hypothetical protein